MNAFSGNIILQNRSKSIFNAQFFFHVS